MTGITTILSNCKNFLECAIRSDGKTSLLTHNESNAAKGILILLIVLGHNKYLMSGGWSNLFLYSFHVYAFYFLPFLYDFRNSGLKKLLKKNLIRLYVPYSAVFLLLILITTFYGKTPSLKDGAMAYVCGSQFLLYNNLGFGSFLWFIPTMFSILFYRWIYYNIGFRYRCVMLAASAICLIGFAYVIPAFVYTWIYSPMCLTVALGMILPAVCLREFCKRLKYPVLAMAFFSLTVAMMVIYPLKDEYGITYLTINRLICPILIFSFLLSIRKFLAGHKILIDFGKESFKIYLIHIFIYNAIYLLLDRYNPGIYTGIAVYCIGFAGAYMISKIPLLRYVFPH